ncbi:MAG: hypothetical protein WJ306_02465 [Ferrovum myxofaciens]
MDGFIQRQAVRVECNRFGTLEITIAIAKAANLRAVGQGLHFQQRRRHCIQGAGELDVDVGFAFRSHSRC